MAVVQRIAKVVITNATGARTFTATATVLDTPAGQSVTITWQHSTSGTLQPAAPTGCNVTCRMADLGTTIISFGLGNGTGTQTKTFFFTADGTSTGSPRCGTVEILIHVVSSGGGATADYDVYSDGSVNTVPAGTTTTLDRGWIRGTTTQTIAASNVAVGGAKSEPAEYGESLYVQTTDGAASYQARTLTIASSAGGLSGTTASSSGPTRSVTFSAVVDDRFTAAVTGVSWTVTVPNSTLTGSPAWVYTTTTTDTINVDPRLTASHHLQTDDATFAVSKNRASKQMLSSEVGYIATRYVTARTASGVNGLTVTQNLYSARVPSMGVTGSSSTATRDGQAGWTDMLAWGNAKPGGAWNKTTDVTAPATIDADTHIVNGSDTLTMLAPNPAYRIVAGAGPLVNGVHWTPGSDLQVGGGLIDTSAGALLTPLGTPTVTAARFSPGGLLQYLEDDLVTWTTVPAGSSTPAANTINLAPATAILGPTADARVFLLVIPAASTATWGYAPVSFLVQMSDASGTPYTASVNLNPMQASNPHSGYGVDAVGLALTGGITFR